MGLNIKNRLVEEHIRELAELTGEGKTEAVDKAVRERLDKVRAEKRIGMADRLLALGRKIHEDLGGGPAPDHDALLYDPKTGLPRDD